MVVTRLTRNIIINYTHCTSVHCSGDGPRACMTIADRRIDRA